MILFKPLRWEVYDPTGHDADPEYHAMWSRRFADRAVFSAKVAMALAVIAAALALASIVAGLLGV